MREKMSGYMPEEKNKEAAEMKFADAKGLDVFKEGVFEELKSNLGIELPFTITRKDNEAKGEEGTYNYQPAYTGYEISLPIPEGYYWHQGPVRDADIDTTHDYVSKESVDQKTGKQGTSVVEGGVGEWGAWCEEYGYDEVSTGLRKLEEAVSSMLGHDDRNRRRGEALSLAEVVDSETNQ